MLSRLSISFVFAVTVLTAEGRADTTRATAPVGFMRYELSAGVQTVGFPLVNAAVATGRVDEIAGTSLFAAVGTEIGARLDPALAYYLEFTAGPDGDVTFVGDRIEIDVARTTDAANPGNRLRLQLGSAFSTLRALPAALTGYRFVIRPHVTLASALGAGSGCALRGGNDATTADQVYLLRNGSFQSYLLQADATTGESHWVKFPEGNLADDLPIAPGTGLFVRHVGSSGVELRHVGTVRTNAFVQPLAAGHTLVSEPFPVANTFETRGMTTFNGFTAGESAEAADNVSVWSGSTYRTLFYSANAGATPSWRNAEATAQSASHENTAAFSPHRAVLVQKLAADPHYVVPNPL